MTKTNIIKELALEHSMTKEQVEKIVEGLIKKITKAALKKNDTHFRGFGSFLLVKKKAKIGQDIRKGTAVNIPAHYSIKFKVSKTLIQRINKPCDEVNY